MRTGSTRALALGGLLALELAGCTSEPIRVDPDAGATSTGGDAEPPVDSGADSGATTGDSGPPDSGPPDSGPPDSGPPDSGPPDSGLPSVTLALPLRFERIELDAAPDELTDFVFLPGGGELLILGKRGGLYHYALERSGDGAGSTELLGSVNLSRVFAATDCGAISLLLDNDFAENAVFYVSKCTSLQASGVYRYRFDASDYAGIDASETLIVEAAEPLSERAWHNVGSLNMSPDGVLWVPFGDKTIGENGQDTNDNLGSVLRIVPNREPEGSGYEPAPDNPFLDEPEMSPDIYAVGLRSPFRAVLDLEGRLWFGDVGSDRAEEINVVTEPGQNFGWSLAEGACADDCNGLTDPEVFWGREGDHDFIIEDPEAPVIGGRVAVASLAYDASIGDRYGGLLDDMLIYGDFCVGFLRGLTYQEGHVASDTYVGHLNTAAALRQGPDGYVYALSFGRCQTDKVNSTDAPSALYRALPSVIED